ncbi:MAG: DUF420 domain-containing protein [Planctomycetaceae bacterium]
MIEHGFLGNDASFMLDFVVVALVLVVPVLLYSLYVVKFQRNFGLHRFLQIALGVVLFVAVAAFEVDMRMHGGWENIINKDPENVRLDAQQLQSVSQVLWIHLVFAISTPFLWIATTVYALRRFPKPPQPGEHSRLHKTLGWISVVDLVATSVTGLWFYYVAFMAA